MSHAQATVTTRHRTLGREAWAASTSGWWSRAAARLIDELIQVFAMLPFCIGLVLVFDATATGAGLSPATDPALHLDRVNMLIGLGLVVVGTILALGTWAWNRVVQQGRTGQSLGKAAMKIALVSGTTGKPVGVWSAFLRELAHVVDGVLVVGYLWPLWDDRRQTLADKLVDTEVAPEARLACEETTWVQRALA